MIMQKIPRVIFAAAQSGSGKTTIVTGLLAALQQAGQIVQPYKVGPDYIDPGYHTLAAGRKGHNLDTWLVPEEKLPEIFQKSAGDAELCVIEGVMGLFDGGRNGISSTAALAKLLKTPVILVLDVRSMGDSAAAIALGFRKYDPDVYIAGVILNRVGSENHRQMIEEAMEKISMPVLGVVYRKDELQMPERHLGLVPYMETDAKTWVEKLGTIIGASLDLPAILDIAEAAPSLPRAEKADIFVPKKIKLAVALDEAFSFYYPASLAVLENLGAELLYFSPLNDEKIPEADGIILGGGFPEMFARQLSENTAMLAAFQKAKAKKIPLYAECGGFMYLTQYLTDFNGEKFPMAAVIPGSCQMNQRLQTVGYVEAVLQHDSILGEKGTQLRGHEFHFSSQTAEEYPWGLSFTKLRNGQQYPGGFANDHIMASYLHVHFAGNLEAAAYFIGTCEKYAQKKQEQEVSSWEK